MAPSTTLISPSLSLSPKPKLYIIITISLALTESKGNHGEKELFISSTFKYHSIGGRVMKDRKLNDDPLDSSTVGGDLLGVFSWPPKSHKCSFCEREFKSAQALGGHMNVHRRDRARLRQYSPPRDIDPNPNPNPNPNFSSSPSTRLTSTILPLISPSLSSPSSASHTEIKKWGRGGGGADVAKMNAAKTLFGVGKFDDFAHEKGCKVVKKAADTRLELENGLLRDSKDDLDLELRLGYS